MKSLKRAGVMLIITLLITFAFHWLRQGTAKCEPYWLTDEHGHFELRNDNIAGAKCIIKSWRLGHGKKFDCKPDPGTRTFQLRNCTPE